MFIVNLAGYLGKDPETRFTPSGQKVTSFSVATSHRKGKEDVTIWVRVTIWGDRFDKLLPYLKKGSAVIVTGKFNPPSTYVDKEGKTQVNLEVVAEMLEFSPFGKNERSADSAQDVSSGTGQTVFEANSASYNKSPSFGSGFGGSQMGQGHGGSQNPYGAHSLDDDALPF